MVGVEEAGIFFLIETGDGPDCRDDCSLNAARTNRTGVELRVIIISTR